MVRAILILQMKDEKNQSSLREVNTVLNNISRAMWAAQSKGEGTNQGLVH